MSSVIHEICGCGAQFRIEGAIAETAPEVEKWRSDHACSVRRTRWPVDPEKDWRQDRVGQPCDVCGEILTEKEGLTTLQGRPLHISCKVCGWCDKARPYTLAWMDSEGEEQAVLLHPGRCERAWKLSQIEVLPEPVQGEVYRD